MNMKLQMGVPWGCILVYYFIATFMSIDKIIGKIYPVFGICLIIMAVGVAVGISVSYTHLSE